MILSAERDDKIIDHLSQKRSAKIEELAELLKVSANTIRRDLDRLEEKGLLERIQGGAVLYARETVHPYMIARQGINEAEKRAIGREAVKMLHPHSSIILDSGSTTIMMADYMDQLRDLTVLTNSLDICNRFLSLHRVTVIASGGVLLESTHSFVGTPAERFFGTVHVEQLFIGAKGISIEAGLTNLNIHETPVKRVMIEAADEVILLADHSKFGKEGLSRVAGIESLHAVITDSGTEPEYIEALESKGIRVIVARLEE